MFPLKDNIPTDRTPWVTLVLIAANIVAFVLQIRAGGSFWSGPDAGDAIAYGFIPYELTNPGQQCELVRGGTAVACGDGVGEGPPSTYATLFSAMFMHGGIVHLAGNLLFLWIFGNNVEDSMGPVRYLVFYLLGGLAATGLQTLVDPDSVVPNIGASGAIAAVLGGYLVLYPRARVLTVVFLVIFFWFLQLPAMLFLVVWFALQVVSGLADFSDPTGGGGGVAYFAHIGGFLFGALAVRLFATKVKPGYGRHDARPKYPVY